MCQIIPPEKDWIDLLGALITPIVAFIGIYIAYQQRTINKNRLKHELFDKRYKIYIAIDTFIKSVITSGKVPDGGDFKFLSETKSSALFFDSSIKELTDKIFKKAAELDGLVKVGKDLSKGPELKENIQAQREIKNWFHKEYKTLEAKFTKYLRLED